MSNHFFQIIRPVANMLCLLFLAGAGCSVAGSSGSSSLADSNAATLKVQAFRVADNEVTVDTAAAAKILISVINPQTVRVWFSEDGSFVKEPSYAVISEHWPKTDFGVTDQGGYIRVRTTELAVRIYKNPLKIDFFKADDATLISAQEESHGMGTTSDKGPFVTRLMGPSEHFYGLGQDNAAYLGNLDRRGSVRTMWTGQQINKGKVTAEIPIPFFMSTGEAGGGYGMFFDNTYRTEFDMGKESNDHFSWKSAGGKLLYYFFYGPAFSTILDRYTELTGRPSLPPLWSLGYIQSKCTYYNWEEMDDVVHNMRQKQIPMDALVIDYDWPDQLQNFKWNARWHGQSPAKIREYGAAGVKLMISNSGPMIRKESSNYQDGLAHGIFATDGRGSTVTCGHYGGDLMDFTAPGMKAWLWPQLRHLYDEGIAGWWLDLTEPEGEPSQTVYQGGPAAKIHNVYSLLNTKAYYDMQKQYDPASRPFILTRTGFAGIQRYGAAIWSGDINSDYETFAAHCPEALNTGMSGIPLWTNDSGGFLTGLYKNNLKDHGLLYQRWLQFSAFAAITRAHHVGPSAPYMFGAEVEEGARKYLQLRYRLMPYLYATTWMAHTKGAPIMRPLVFAYQNDANVYKLKDQFLFGDALMVAPVLAEGRTSRNVYFPQGRWIDYDYGYEYQGSKSYGVKAPIERIPLFVRSGAIIPMAPDMQFTGEKPWDPLTLDLYPDGQSTFTLYADDGKSNAFEEQHRFTETVITSDTAPQNGVRITINESNKLFTPHVYRLNVHLLSTPTMVSVQQQRLTMYSDEAAYAGAVEGAYWNAQNLTLYTKLLTGGSTGYQIEIKLAGDQLARPTPPQIVVDDNGNTPTPPGGVGRMPHFYPPPSLPTRISAANYDNGGEGVGYHTLTPNYKGKKYRNDDIGIEDTMDTGGGYDVAMHGAGEWLEYTINVPQAGLYHAEIRSASEEPAAIHLEAREKPITPRISLAATGGRQTWASVMARDIYFGAGEQILKIAIDQGHPSLNYIAFTKSNKFQLVDPLDNFTLMYAHSAGLGFDTSNSEFFKGDSSRLNRMTTKGEEAIYKVDRAIGAVSFVTYFWPGQTATDFKFFLSADGSNYWEVKPARQFTAGNWNEVDYRLEQLGATTRFIKVVFPEAEPSWSPQLGQVALEGISTY